MFHVFRHIPVSAATQERFEEFSSDLAQTLTRIRGGADFFFVVWGSKVKAADVY